MSVKIVCAWCGKTVSKGDKEGCLVSHGICYHCGLRLKKEIEDYCSQLKQTDKERRLS